MPLRTLVTLLASAAIVTAAATLGYRATTRHLQAQHSGPARPETSHEIAERLAARARELWRLRDEADYAHVYDFYGPSLRAPWTREEFVQKNGYLLFSDSELLVTEIGDSTQGRTLVRAHWLFTRNCFHVGGPRAPKSAVAEETWSFDGDEWYLSGGLRWLSSAEADEFADL